jgi:uncharacterized MAPEG superfamily protein
MHHMFVSAGPRATFRKFHSLAQRAVWMQDIHTTDVEDFAIAYMSAYNALIKPNTF